MDDETYNPWTIVNAVFHQLADAGLHPVLGTTGDPGEAAAALLARSVSGPRCRPTRAD